MEILKDRQGRPIAQLIMETNGDVLMNDKNGRRIGFMRDGDTYNAQGQVIGRNANLLGTLIRPYEDQ